MLPTAIEELRTSSVVRVPAEPVIAAVQVIGRAVWVALVVPEDPVVRVALAVPVVWVVPENPAVWAALVVPGNRAVPAVWAALVVPENPVVSENPVVPVALDLAPAQVRAELELVPVAVELGHARVAVPLLRTRSVTAAHRRALALGPKREEDMAVAAAATTREPAAA